MTGFILRRMAYALPVLFGVSVLVFLTIHLSGDPVALMLPPEATDAQIREFQRLMGFDQPLHVQYGRFLWRVLHGDLGESLRYRTSAGRLALERMPATLLLAGTALALSVAIAIPSGVISAVRRGSTWDDLAMSFALVGQSMPVFWTGILLILLFSVKLQLLPSSGSGGLRYLVLPALTLGTYSAARVTRLVRSGMLETLGQDYVRTAWAKGLSARRVIFRHALRNAMLPVITLIGLELGTNLGGAVVTETVFAWPGTGRLVVTAIFARDYPVVQAVTLLTALVFVLLNLVVDLLYGVADPRIRYQ